MLEVEQSSGVTLVRFRHGKVNALDLELLRALTAVMRDLDPAGAAVLTGSGNLPAMLCMLVEFSRGSDFSSTMARATISEATPAATPAMEMTVMMPTTAWRRLARR